MAEKKDKAPETKSGSEFQAHSTTREKTASRWTLQACMKVAKRFTTMEDWAQGAPSSFKAATARGFVTDCSKHMTPGRAKVTKTVAKPKTAIKTATATKKPVKKSA